jgi:hypothetical protein
MRKRVPKNAADEGPQKQNKKQEKRGWGSVSNSALSTQYSVLRPQASEHERPELLPNLRLALDLLKLGRL